MMMVVQEEEVLYSEPLLSRGRVTGLKTEAGLAPGMPFHTQWHDAARCPYGCHSVDNKGSHQQIIQFHGELSIVTYTSIVQH